MHAALHSYKIRAYRSINKATKVAIFGIWPGCPYGHAFLSTKKGSKIPASAVLVQRARNI